MPVKPTILAMVPCSDVEYTGFRATIKEVVWDAPGYYAFPLTLGKFKVYIALTGIHGALRMKLRLNSSNPNEQAYFMWIDTEAQTPIDSREIVADLKDWIIPAAGEWHLDLLWQDEILVSRRMRWRALSEAPGR